MIPNDTLLCTQISVLSNHHQRSFKKIWKQVKKWPIARYYIVRESKLRGSIQFLLLGETVTTWKTVWKAFGSYKGWKTPGKHGPLNKLSRAFRDSQRLKQQSRDLQQSRQGMYVMVIILKIFVDSCQWKQVFLSLFWLLLRLFSSYQVALSSLNMRTFDLTYCILFDPVWFYFLGGLLFSKEIENVWICGRGKWGCLMGSRGRRCAVWVKNLFSINFLKGELKIT